jgi:hypothetical protein
MAYSDSQREICNDFRVANYYIDPAAMKLTVGIIAPEDFFARYRRLRDALLNQIARNPLGILAGWSSTRGRELCMKRNAAPSIELPSPVMPVYC